MKTCLVLPTMRPSTPKIPAIERGCPSALSTLLTCPAHSPDVNPFRARLSWSTRWQRPNPGAAIARPEKGVWSVVDGGLPLSPQPRRLAAMTV